MHTWTIIVEFQEYLNITINALIVNSMRIHSILLTLVILLLKIR